MKNMYKRNYIRDAMSFFVGGYLLTRDYPKLHVMYEFNDSFIKTLAVLVAVTNAVLSTFSSALLAKLFSIEVLSLFTIIVMIVFVLFIYPSLFFGLFKLLGLIRNREYSQEQMARTVNEVASGIRNQVENSGETTVTLDDIREQIKDKL